MKVLFVCTGNTCRSPMAAALYKRKNPDADVTSAGLAASGGSACENAVLVMKELGIDISDHVSQPVNHKLLAAADQMVCMTQAHKSALLVMGAEEAKITVLDITDPFGGDLEVYRSCRDEITKKLFQLCPSKNL